MNTLRHPRQFWIGLIAILLFFGLLIPYMHRSLKPEWGKSGTCVLYAELANVGELKNFAPVKLAGVQVGCVQKISLTPARLRAKVEILISKEICKQLPKSSTLKITSILPFGETFVELSLPKGAKQLGSDAPMMESGDKFIRAIGYTSLEELALKFLPASSGEKPKTLP